MKSLITFLIIALAGFKTANAQNVGIGTNAPHPSAKLHIDANNAGILIPSLDLNATTFPSPGPATGLLVYNSNASYGGGIGFYFNSGTPASPVWFKILDQSNSMTPDQDWFESNTTDNPDNITDNVYTRGNVGIGDFSSTNPTSRLDIKDVIDGGNAINVNMTDGAAASSVGLNINSFAANTNSRTGVSINMANTSNSAGMRINNIGSTGMSGIQVDADANGNGTGIQLGQTTTLGTGVNIRGGTGVLYNALSSGDGTGIRIGGTTTPQKGVEANAVYSTGTGLIGGVSTVGSPTSPVRTGVFGYATSNSTTGTDIQHGGYFSTTRGGNSGTTRSYGSYARAEGTNASNNGLHIGAYGTATVENAGTGGAIAGQFEAASNSGRHLSIAATGGADVYLGSTDADRPSNFTGANVNVGTGNTNTTFMHNARLSNQLTFRQTAAGTNTVSIVAPASISASYTMALPTAQGTSNQVLTNDGSGNLSWSSGGSIIGAANGLNIASNSMRLGGTLDANTTINQDGNEFRLTGSGNVGIGVAGALSSKLHVAGIVRVEDGIILNDGTEALPAYRFNSDSDNGMYLPGSNQIAFSAGGSERIRINGAATDGRIGINEKSPTAALEIVRTNNSASFISTNYANVPNYDFRRAQGTPSAPTSTGINSVLARLRGIGYDGAAFQPAAQIAFEIDATSGAGDMPGRIVFSTTLDGSTSLTERMRISNNGNVTISNLGTGLVKSTSGVLSNATGGTDFENPLTFSLPLSRTGNAISIPQSNTSTDGFLSSTDWNTFNNKEEVLTFSNGLTRNVNAIKLGGALTEATIISGLTGTNKMSFTGSGVDAFNVNGTTLSIDATNGRVGIGTASPGHVLTVDGTIHAVDFGAAGSQNIIIGDDAFLTDIDASNMTGLYGVQNNDRAGLRLGSNSGSYIYGRGGNIGVGLDDPQEKLHVSGNSYNTGAAVFQGFSIMEIDMVQNSSLTGPDNAYHTVTCPNGYAMTNLAIYASSRLDGGERIMCVKVNDLITTNHTWRGRSGGVSASGTNTNTFDTGADNQDHSCSCNAGEVATGFEAYSNSHLDGRMKLRCTQLKTGYSLANNGTETINGYTVRGMMANINIPWNTSRDDQYHISDCPPGTFVTGLAIYAISYLDGEMRCYCSGIKR